MEKKRQTSKMGLSKVEAICLDIPEQDLLKGLNSIVDSPRFGSIILDLFSTKTLKYRGEIHEDFFKISFTKKLQKPIFFYPEIHAKYESGESGLTVKLEVTSVTWITRFLLIQLILILGLVSAIIFQRGDDWTDILAMYAMLSMALIPMILLELYRMRKGARIAHEEVVKDLRAIVTNYHNHRS